jgi:hypothetical protein
LNLSVVVPAAPSQRAFLPLCIAGIHAQRWPETDYEILQDDGPTLTGPKRNALCRQSAASFIVFCDADDIILPGRFDAQMAALAANPAALVCGTSVYYCHDLRTGQAVEKRERAGVACASLMFRREAWERFPFDEHRHPGAVNAFIRHYRDHTIDLADLRSIFIYTRHRFATVGPQVPIYGEHEAEATAAVHAMISPAQLTAYRLAAGVR